MKNKYFILLACLSVILLASCEREKTYTSGKYYYSYNLVNATSSPIVVTRALPDKTGMNFYLLVSDTANIAYYEVENEISNEQPYEVVVEQLHRPSLQDGYKGTVDEAEYTLTYKSKVYKIDSSQANSFLNCANYKGVQSPKSVFIYEYYFTIDEDYIATLPLKK